MYKRQALIELFKILDTPVSERDEYLEEELAQFPYVNGGLFADETIEIPPFTAVSYTHLIHQTGVSLDPETRATISIVCCPLNT